MWRAAQELINFAVLSRIRRAWCRDNDMKYINSCTAQWLMIVNSFFKILIIFNMLLSRLKVANAKVESTFIVPVQGLLGGEDARGIRSSVVVNVFKRLL